MPDKPERLHPSLQGKVVGLLVKVGYPGSRVSDLLIGGHKVQVPNECIRQTITDFADADVDEVTTNVSALMLATRSSRDR